MKNVVTNSLKYLVNNSKARVYGFVVMPNHIHLVWRNMAMNGKEFPDESFLKFTGHQFRKDLISANKPLDKYLVDKSDRMYQFWQRNSLPIKLTSREMIEQVLEYIHLNPLQTHWNLVTDPSDYFHSSCSFYERNDSRFEWLTDYRQDFS